MMCILPIIIIIIIIIFFFFFFFMFICLFIFIFFCYCSIHNCFSRILQDMIKYFLKHKTRHFFRTLCIFLTYRSVKFCQDIILKQIFTDPNLSDETWLFIFIEKGHIVGLSIEGVVYRAKMPTHI